MADPGSFIRGGSKFLKGGPLSKFWGHYSFFIHDCLFYGQWTSLSFRVKKPPTSDWIGDNNIKVKWHSLWEGAKNLRTGNCYSKRLCFLLHYRQNGILYKLIEWKRSQRTKINLFLHYCMSPQNQISLTIAKLRRLQSLSKPTKRIISSWCSHSHSRTLSI